MQKILLSGVVLWLASGQCLADVAAGKARAATVCAVCHGPQGLSVHPHVPNLAGQPQLYLSDQLHKFRSGKRQSEVMAVIAKQLTDQDIDDVALWYSSLQVTVQQQ